MKKIIPLISLFLLLSCVEVKDDFNSCQIKPFDLNLTWNQEETISFSCTGNFSFRCQLNSGDFVPCTKNNSMTFKNLQHGDQVFGLEITRNEDLESIILKYSFFVDLASPDPASSLDFSKDNDNIYMLWTPSKSDDLASQTIFLYRGINCDGIMYGKYELSFKDDRFKLSIPTESNNYSFKVLSKDYSNRTSLSICSPRISI